MKREWTPVSYEKDWVAVSDEEVDELANHAEERYFKELDTDGVEANYMIATGDILIEADAGEIVVYRAVKHTYIGYKRPMKEDNHE